MLKIKGQNQQTTVDYRAKSAYLIMLENGGLVEENWWIVWRKLMDCLS